MSENGLQRAYEVVANADEQYSIWPAQRELPLGWRAIGFRGSQSECLSQIQAIWTEQIPLSARPRPQSSTSVASSS